MSHPEIDEDDDYWNQAVSYTEEEIRAAETLGSLNGEDRENRYAKVVRNIFPVSY
jgi:hypothetical protein